eukprot:140335_1
MPNETNDFESLRLKRAYKRVSNDIKRLTGRTPAPMEMMFHFNNPSQQERGTIAMNRLINKDFKNSVEELNIFYEMVYNSYPRARDRDICKLYRQKVNHSIIQMHEYYAKIYLKSIQTQSKKDSLLDLNNKYAAINAELAISYAYDFGNIKK